MGKKKRRLHARPKPKHLTERRRRALVESVAYGSMTRPNFYVCAFINDSSRAAMLQVVVQYCKPYMVASKIAAADGRDAPNLNATGELDRWLDASKDDLRIIRCDGVTAWALRADVDKLGASWDDHLDYIMYEDIRRNKAWANGKVFKVTLQQGRHCNTCRRSHFPNEQNKVLPYFYGEDRDLSGLNAAIPEGYYVATLKAGSNAL